MNKRQELVKTLYTKFVLGNKIASTQEERFNKLKLLFAKEITAGKKSLKITDEEGTAIVINVLKDDLNELKSKGKGWDDPEVKDIVEKLTELGAPPPQIQTFEEAKKMKELQQQKEEDMKKYWGESYPKKDKKELPPVKEEEPEEPLEELELPQTQKKDVDVKDVLEKLQETQRPDEPKRVKKFKTQEELQKEKAINGIFDKYKNEEISLNDAKQALKTLDPTLTDSVIVAKLSIIRPLSSQEVALEQLLTNPQASRQKILEEIREKYKNSLSGGAIKINNILPSIIGANPETISPLAMQTKLFSKKREYLDVLENISESDIQDINDYILLSQADKKEKSRLEIEKLKNEKLSTLSDNSKKLLKLLYIFEDSAFVESKLISKDMLDTIKTFFGKTYDSFAEELINYYKKINKIKNIVPEKEDLMTRKIPNESMIYSKKEEAFSPGTVIEEKTIDKDGKEVVLKTYAPTTRQLIACSNGHFSKPFEVDKKTNKVIPRTKCEFCKENISIVETTETLNKLQKEIDFEIEKERVKNKNNFHNGIISQSQYAELENDLDVVEATKQFDKQIGTILNQKLDLINDEKDKIEMEFATKKITRKEYERKINEIIEKEDKIYKDTDLRSLQTRISNLTPKPFYMFQYDVKLKGPWGLGDKSRARGEDILESGTRAPTEGESYKVQSFLDRMNVEADEYGYVKLEKQQDGSLLATPLPKDKHVYVTFRDLSKKLAITDDTRKFKSLLAEQEIKNEFINNKISFKDAVNSLTDILNGNAEFLDESIKSKNVIIAKEKLILEQLKYKKIDHDLAISELKDLGVPKEQAIEKTTNIVQYNKLPKETPYVCSRPSYSVMRDGLKKSIIWGDDSPNAIWNIESIRPAIQERLKYVNEVLKPRAKVYNAAEKALEAAKEISSILKTTTEKEKSLGLDNLEKREFIKQLIKILKSNPNVLNTFNKHQSKKDIRKGLNQELYSFQLGLKKKKDSGEELSKEERVIAKSGRKDDLTGKSLLHIALDWIDYQKQQSKPLSTAKQNLEKYKNSFEKAYMESGMKTDVTIQKIPEDLMSYIGQSEEEIEEISDLKNVVESVKNELEKEPEVVGLSNSMEGEEEDEKSLLDVLKKLSSLRKEKLLTILIDSF